MTSLLLLASLLLQETKPEIFSGPQKDEKVPSCTVRLLSGKDAEKDLDLVEEAKGAPTLIVFIHETTRLVGGVIREVDAWAARQDALKTTIIFLTDDKIKTLNYAPVFIQSLKIQCPLAVSLDGIEGPGAWGLNKEVQMTVVVAKEGKVTANFALVAPSAAQDAPRIKAALQEVLAKKIETLEDALNEIRRLNEVILKLEAELAAGKRKPEGRPMEPGQDAKLTETMRGLIQARATKEQCEAIVKQVKEMVGDNADLRKQVHFQTGVCVEKMYGNAEGQEALKQLNEWSKP